MKKFNSLICPIHMLLSFRLEKTNQVSLYIKKKILTAFGALPVATWYRRET